MHSYQGWRQLQSVRHIFQPSQDRKQTDLTWCQLAFDPKHLHTLHRRDTKVHTVNSFKLKRLASLVGITFLLSLGNFQIGLDAMDYLLGLSDKVWTKDHLLTRLDPVQRCTTSTAIQCLEGCHSETLLITIVVRELSQW
jgi:hypothetical protein